MGISSLLDLVVNGSVFAVFGGFCVTCLTAAAGTRRRLAAGFMLVAVTCVLPLCHCRMLLLGFFMSAVGK